MGTRKGSGSWVGYISGMQKKNTRLLVLMLALAGCDQRSAPQGAAVHPVISPERAAFVAANGPTPSQFAEAQQACERPLDHQLPGEEPLRLPPVCAPGTTPTSLIVELRALDDRAQIPAALQSPFELHLAPYAASRPDRACQYVRVVDFDADEWPRATLGWNPAPDQPVRGDDNYVTYRPGYDPGLYARAAEGRTILFEQSAPKRLPDVPRDCRERFTLPELVMAGRGGPKIAAIITPNLGSDRAN